MGARVLEGRLFSDGRPTSDGAALVASGGAPGGLLAASGGPLASEEAP